MNPCLLFSADFVAPENLTRLINWSSFLSTLYKYHLISLKFSIKFDSNLSILVSSESKPF